MGKYKYILIGLITIIISILTIYILGINTLWIFGENGEKEWLNFVATFSGGVIGGMFTMVAVFATQYFTEKSDNKKDNEIILGTKYIIFSELKEYFNSVDKEFFNIVNTHYCNQYCLKDYTSVNRLYKLDIQFKEYVHKLIAFGKIEEGELILKFYDKYLKVSKFLESSMSNHQVHLYDMIDLIGKEGYKKLASYVLYEVRKGPDGTIKQFLTNPSKHKDELENFLKDYNDGIYSNLNYLNKEFRQLMKYLSSNENI